MPSWPGSWLLVITVQAGTVMGGVQLSNSPQAPVRVSWCRFGSSSAGRLKTSSGGTQSRPITKTLREPPFAPLIMVIPPRPRGVRRQGPSPSLSEVAHALQAVLDLLLLSGAVDEQCAALDRREVVRVF